MRRRSRFARQALPVLTVILAACACGTQPDADSAAPPATAPPETADAEAAPVEPELLRGRIVFSHEGDVWVMNADGSDRTRLTTDPAPDFDPAWSPDGRRIAFRTHRDGNEEVYVMNADGSGQRNASRSPGGDYSPAWSPDGEWIAFMSDRSGGPNVWLMRPDGAAPRQLTDLPGISEYPSWSPDGARLAFHCTSGRVLESGVGDFEICVVDRDGSNLEQITDAPGESKLPAWSPDGAWIAFQSDRNGWPSGPKPPGYDGERYGEYEVYVVQPDGSGLRRVTTHPDEDDTSAAWSPAGDYLLVSRYGCLDVLSPDGSRSTRLTDGLCADEFPDWGP